MTTIPGWSTNPIGADGDGYRPWANPTNARHATGVNASIPPARVGSPRLARYPTRS